MPASHHSNSPSVHTARGRGRGSGHGKAVGNRDISDGQARATYRNENNGRGYGRGGGNSGYQRHGTYAGPYGQSSNYAFARDQSHTSGWNQATQGGSTSSQRFHHHGPNGSTFSSLHKSLQQNGGSQNVSPPLPLPVGVPAALKRVHSTAFTKTASMGPKPKAAPAVPSFNAGIPFSQPKNAADHPSPKSTKARKHNQLGLTPASQDQESSSDDENEEAKLALQTFNNANMVQFEYKGRTATLRTAAEIAAWVAERKKNYPTQAKAEAAKKEAADKKRKWDEIKKQREESAQAIRRREREKTQQEELRLKALESKKRKDREREQKKAEDEDVDDEIKAKKARIRGEKLKLKADMAELKVLEAEAAAMKAKRRSSLQSGSPRQDEQRIQEMSNREGDSTMLLMSNKAENMADVEANKEGVARKIDHDGEDARNNAKQASTTYGSDYNGKQELSKNSTDVLSFSPLTSESSVLSDAESTSSSGSSPSSSSLAPSDTDTDSAPDQTTSKRLQPTRVLPPPRGRLPTYTNHLCRSLLATGHCKRGDDCQYSHDLPDTLPSLGERKAKLKEKRKIRLEKVNAVRGPREKERRKGLWQVLVEKEEEEARKHLLRAIIFMGGRGMLGENETKTGGTDGVT